MTVLVGLKCRGGVVVGSDSSATFTTSTPNFNTIEQPTKKVFVIDNKVIVAGTGQIGLGQRFSAAVEKAWNEGAFKGTSTPLEIAKRLCAAGIKDFGETSVIKGQYGALVAFPCGKKYCLCEFSVSDFQPELKDENIWYVSMGSGQTIADPFLGLLRRVFWKDSPPELNEGIFAVTWTLHHAIELNPGGIKGPSQIAVLSPDMKGDLRARLLDDAELAEHQDNVLGAEGHLGGYSQRLSGKTEPSKEIPSP